MPANKGFMGLQGVVAHVKVCNGGYGRTPHSLTVPYRRSLVATLTKSIYEQKIKQDEKIIDNNFACNSSCRL
ncbi:hypothetical protein SAMN05216357_101299 [Porphyromonadaceae bacterium KH3CP3RA]|nr:hypothetical protein SAMN05216357_101299 [Porphyromonadaceae bacterium KH3CP3RA]